MKKLILSSLLLAVTLTMSAVPAKKEWRTFVQSDGTQVTLMLIGDENFHCFQTTDGLPVVEQDGNYYYANSKGNYLIATNMLAHNVELRSVEESAAVAELGKGSADIERLWKAAPNMQNIRHKAIGTPSGDFHGSKKGIIILVAFPDIPFSIENPQQAFSDMVNKEGYTNSFGANGSVHDYFKDQSRGAFDLTFDVVGPYTAPQEARYYGENSTYGIDKNVRQLITWAMREADNDVNYKDYDWDGDGEVDQVFVLYAGYGEAQYAPSWTIWPHESSLGMQSFRLDGVTLNTYACGQELDGNSGTRMAGLGTICHEFTHCLGLPDFYDTNTNSGSTSTNYGMGTWDLMCSGSYNGNSWSPAAYTGYERNFCGWLDYKVLKESDACVVSDLKPIEEEGDVFVVYNPNNNNEYYVFEQRNRRSGWDRGTGGQGLLIYHVNYNASRWRNNTVNTSGQGVPCMQVVPADDSFEDYATNISQDLWPATVSLSLKNEFSENSTPAATLFNKNTDGTNKLHIKLSKIRLTSSTRTISFTYNDGTESYEELGIQGVSVANDGQQKVYSINGMYVGDNLDNLKRGIYVVKQADGTSKKIVVE